MNCDLPATNLALGVHQTHPTASTIKQSSKPAYANTALFSTQTLKHATHVRLVSLITMEEKLVALTAFQIHQAVVLLQQTVTPKHALTFVKQKLVTK